MDNEKTTSENMIIEEKKPKSALREVIEWIEIIVIAFIIAIFIRTFIFEPVKVVGSSMENTLLTGEKLYVNKLGYRFNAPERGDIIVLQYKKGNLKYSPIPDRSETDFIKRIIGVPGDVIEIQDGYVSVNGKKTDETYVKKQGSTRTRSTYFKRIVPENNVFVLGDNREVSYDSREIGFIDYSRIKGKAQFRIFPISEFGSIY